MTIKKISFHNDTFEVSRKIINKSDSLIDCIYDFSAGTLFYMYNVINEITTKLTTAVLWMLLTEMTN